MRKIIISILLVFLLSLVGCVQPDTVTPTIPTENASTETGGSSSSETTTPASTNNSVTPATDETTNNSEPTTTEPEVVYVEVPVEVPVEVYVEVPETFSNGVWIKEFTFFDYDTGETGVIYLVSEGDGSDYYQLWYYFQGESSFYRLEIYDLEDNPNNFSNNYDIRFSDVGDTEFNRVHIYKSCNIWFISIRFSEQDWMGYRIYYTSYEEFEETIRLMGSSFNN